MCRGGGRVVCLCLFKESALCLCLCTLICCVLSDCLNKAPTMNVTA